MQEGGDQQVVDKLRISSWHTVCYLNRHVVSEARPTGCTGYLNRHDQPGGPGTCRHVVPGADPPDAPGTGMFVAGADQPNGTGYQHDVAGAD